MCCWIESRSMCVQCSAGCASGGAAACAMCRGIVALVSPCCCVGVVVSCQVLLAAAATAVVGLRCPVQSFQWPTGCAFDIVLILQRHQAAAVQQVVA